MKYKVLILVLFAATVLSSCRKTPIEPEPVKEPSRVEFGVKSYTPGTSVSAEAFSVGDKIGIYVKNSSETTNIFQYSNVGYVCNPTNWRSINADEEIRWYEGDQNVDFYGYHPFVGDGTGAVKKVTPSVDDVEIEYELPLDQTSILTTADRRKIDFMHVANRNIAYAGSQPIELNFRHMLARVRFDVKFLKLQSQDILDNKATITKVEIVGGNIASTMTLNLKSATYTIAGFGSPIVWQGAKDYVTVLDYSTVEAVTVADFMVIPFDPVMGQNTIKFYVTYTEEGVVKNRVFTSYITPVLTDQSIVFKPNKYNIVTALISIDNNSVHITSTIVDWESSNHVITPGN